MDKEIDMRQDTFFFLAQNEETKDVTFLVTFKDDAGDFFTPKIGKLVPKKFKENRMNSDLDSYRVVKVFEGKSHLHLMALADLELLHTEGRCDSLLELLSDIASGAATLGKSRHLTRVLGGAIEEEAS